MARAAKLKVYRTAAGFHDAYVAAPSQKAALAAWGSDHDLFARGIAELVTDPDLSAEPLASPGVVIKRSRGTSAEQIAALPERETRSAKPDKPGDTTAPAVKPKLEPKPTPKPKPKPKPSRAKLAAAEDALESQEAAYRKTLRELAEREAALARERRDLERSRDTDLTVARNTVEDEKTRYDAAIENWKG
jgi:outer membrane biosynthesis protein TonB